ncbi:hypothetical protein DFJ73DRAFT_187774 [Zopfochytrium polystomum]|nr:hypothetical protein DFJ73DRAFT_187774 [Zopfochytrium polystomum]
MWPQANATQQRNPLTRVSPPRAAAATRITTNAGRRGGSSSTPNTPTPGRTFASFDFISGKPAAIAVASTAPPSARGRGSFTPSRSTHGTISNGSSRATPPGRVAGGVSRDQRGRGRGFANRSMVFNTATTRNQPAPVASNPVDSVQFSDEPMSLDGVDQFGNGTDFDDGQEKELSSIVASTRDASNFSFLRPKQQQRTPNGASAGAVLAPMITATPDRLPGAASIRTPPPVKPAAASKFLSAPPKL